MPLSRPPTAWQRTGRTLLLASVPVAGKQAQVSGGAPAFPDLLDALMAAGRREVLSWAPLHTLSLWQASHDRLTLPLMGHHGGVGHDDVLTPMRAYGLCGLFPLAVLMQSEGCSLTFGSPD